jgi:hypothetical protein
LGGDAFPAAAQSRAGALFIELAYDVVHDQVSVGHASLPTRITVPRKLSGFSALPGGARAPGNSVTVRRRGSMTEIS